MALENLIVYSIATGDDTYPHSGTFTIALEGSITIDDSDGSRDTEFGDLTHTGGADEPDQDVTSSTVSAISIGDTVDSRYTYSFTGSDGSSGNVYFIATNAANNYGPLIVSDTPLDPSVTYTFGTFNTDGAVSYSSLVQCFVRGTLIETINGPRPIEALTISERVRTLDNGFQPIRWIGSRRVPAEGNFAPIRIRSGALSNNRDLLVSPQHRMLLEDWRVQYYFAETQVLVSAKSLINDHSITRQTGGMVEYIHLLFDNHEIIFSEGAPSESFHPGPQAVGALAAKARAELFELFPELENDLASYGPIARTNLRPSDARLLAGKM